MRARIFTAIGTAMLIGIAASGPSPAQTRPTLSEAESDIDALEAQVATLEAEVADLEAEQTATQAAVCTQVELDGDTYRPYFCGGACGCIDTSTATACSETAAGVFEVVVLEDQPAIGDCEQGVTQSDYGPCQVVSEVHLCQQPLLFLGTCSPGTSCNGGQGLCGGDGLCYQFCGGGPSECILELPSTGECVAPVVPCSSDADCPSQWSCDLAESKCVKACYYESDCDTIAAQPAAYTLTNVGTTQAPDPVSCQGLSADDVISSSDALACIAEAEGVIGSLCAYLCGDGGIDPGEQCDDGNTTPGDGCDASCQLEP